MMRLLVSMSIIAFACAPVYATPETKQGAAAPIGTPNIEESLIFRPPPAVTLGGRFVGSIFRSASILPTIPTAIPDDPALFTPVLTGSQSSPAAPVSRAGDADRPDSKWSRLRPQVEKRLVGYAFDFGARDLTGAVADNQRFLAVFGWQREIDAPLVAQGE
ncbi:MAG: hypothetical protein R3D62_13185 [Xanthobacteraceae bacterium]